VLIKITDNKGAIVDHFHFADMPAMWHNKVINLPENLAKGMYYITIKTDTEEMTIQVSNQ
jgi:hypothetical protein